MSLPGRDRARAFITEGQPEVIDRILVRLGVDVVPPPSTGPPLWLQLRQMAAHYERHPGALPDDDVDAPHPSDDDYIRDEVYPD